MAATISKLYKKIIAGPDIQMRGFVFVKDSEAIIKELQSLFVQELQDYLTKKLFMAIDDLKANIAEKATKLLRRLNGKNPIILPLIVFYDDDTPVSLDESTNQL
jgi:mRNA degradation ribonuclease J1/J2